MLKKSLVILGGILTMAWGIAHIVPTAGVVEGFGDISIDNSRIIAMEWINEGLTLIFTGILVIAVSLLGDMQSKTAKIVYLLTFLLLIAMSVLSLFTGFRIDFLPFKLCPVIFTVSGILILQGIFTMKSQKPG